MSPPALRRAAWFAGVFVAMLTVGCATSLERQWAGTESGRCARLVASPSEMHAAAERALGSVALVPYVVASTYDADGSVWQPERQPSPGRTAVVSYPRRTGDQAWDRAFVDVGRSFVYDNALSAIAYTYFGLHARAELLLATLASLQSADGSIGFSFNTRGDGFYNRGYVRAGTVAWVGYAFAYFELLTGNQRFREPALRAARYLREHPAVSSSAQGGGQAWLVAGGKGRWTQADTVFEGDYVFEGAATEHQVDAWYLFDALAELTGEPGWAQSRDELLRGMWRWLWLEDEGRFAQGLTPRSVDAGMALDAGGAWSALLLNAIGAADTAQRTLAWVETHFANVDHGLFGYRPYAGEVADFEGVNWYGRSLVYVEGTASVALAHFRNGNANEAALASASLLQLQCLAGGALPYASRFVSQFPPVEAVASTLWWALAAEEMSGARSVRPIWRASSAAPRLIP